MGCMGMVRGAGGLGGGVSKISMFGIYYLVKQFIGCVCTIYKGCVYTNASIVLS